MKSYITKILFITLLFLIPFSFEIGIIDFFSGENISLSMDINSNTAHAINLNCGDLDFSCGITEGILGFWEILWFYTTQIALVLVGIILDVFVFMSINSQFYRSGVIETGWEILRDFTNIIFIFSLLVIAFKIVLDAGSAHAKKTLARTILIALTVNFSLFIAYAVIDASNLLAHTFYNKIGAKGGYNIQTTGDESNAKTETSLSKFITEFVDEDTQSISIAIAGNVNPQAIVTGNSSGGFLENFLIITAAGLINVMLIFIYVKMLAVFLGRTLGLMFSSMLSAMAFVSLTIPGMENKPYIGFNKWLQELISTAFMAPVFLFFIYLAVTFLKDKGFLASLSANPGDGTLSRILIVFVPFLIIGGLLMLAKKISSDMVGELGKMATKGVGMLAGGIIAAPVAVAGGVAMTGGAVAAGGGAIARAAGSGLSRSMSTSKLGAKMMRGGEKTLRLGRKMMSFKADPTKIPGFKQLAGKEMTKSIAKVTGKSLLGHIEQIQKNQKPVFSNEYGKLTSDAENKELKDANDKANNAKRKAEAKYEAELYQKRMEAEIERKRRDNKKDGFKNSKGKSGGYQQAVEQKNTEKLNFEKLNSTLEDIKNNGIDANYSGSDLDKNKAAQEKQKEMADIKAKITLSKDNIQSADNYIDAISTQLNAKKKEVEKVRAKQKVAGEAAETESRQNSAAKASNLNVASKIIKKKKAKGSDFEAAVKKAMKENNMTLDDSSD